MAYWTPENPGAGDLDELSALARELDDSARRADELVAAQFTSASWVLSVWSGIAAAAWEVIALRQRDRMQATSEECRELASKIRRYCTGVEDLAAEERRWKGRIRSAEAEAKTLHLVVTPCPVEGRELAVTCEPSVLALAQDPDSAYRLRSRAATLEMDINAAAGQIGGLARERADLDARLRRVLDEGLATAGGSSGVAFATYTAPPPNLSVSAGTDAADLAGRLDGLAGDELEAAVAELEGLFAARGGNSMFWAAFYEGFPPG